MKEEGRGLAGIEDNVDALLQRLDEHIEKLGRRLVTATKNNTDNTRINGTEITRKNGKENNCMNVLSD